MGMSASQARLLFISSRMNDVEFKSQQIANQKIRLSSESEQLANDYAKSLNKETLKMNIVSDVKGGQAQVDLNYKNLIANGYSIRKVNGKGIVSVSENSEKTKKYESINDVPETEINAAGYTKETQQVTIGSNRLSSSKSKLEKEKIIEQGLKEFGISKEDVIEYLKKNPSALKNINKKSNELDNKTIHNKNKDIDITKLSKEQRVKAFIQKYGSDILENQSPQTGRTKTINQTIYKDGNGKTVSADTVLSAVNSRISSSSSTTVSTVLDEKLVEAFQNNPDYLIQGLLNGIFVLEKTNSETGKKEQVSLSSDPNFDIKHDSSQDAKAE
ncbi:MAG: hypothetical protein ACI37S_05245, partial [Candidatus Gastranaerophilaceae bacterium]